MAAESSAASKRYLRRRWIGGGAAAGLVGVGALVYRAAPAFWQEFAREWNQAIAPPAHRPNPREWPDSGLFATWLGHSTVLLKIDGQTILTDPVFSTRAGIHVGPFALGFKRMVAPALEASELPRVDVLLLSHAHMDHFDIPSLRALENRATSVVTAAATSDLLRVDRYGSVRELAWGESTACGGVTLRAFRVNHWGARMRTDTHRGYNGYVIDAGRYRVVFAGDTAVTDAFRTLPGGAAVTRPVNLAIMPIGAYNPWIHYHCSPEQSWRMANDARAEFVLPVHHATFRLSREPVHEPIERLLTAAGSRYSSVALREIGQDFRLA